MEPQILEFHCAGVETRGKFSLHCTGRGEDHSPEFIIKNLSPEAKTLAITLEDLSHPIKNFTHWIIWNIPASSRIEREIPAGKTIPALGNACQGIGYGLHRYAGPKPPRGKTHQYRFTVYALDVELNMSPYSTKGTFLRHAKGHILQKGTVSGVFE